MKWVRAGFNLPVCQAYVQKQKKKGRQHVYSRYYNKNAFEALQTRKALASSPLLCISFFFTEKKTIVFYSRVFRCLFAVSALFFHIMLTLRVVGPYRGACAAGSTT